MQLFFVLTLILLAAVSLPGSRVQGTPRGSDGRYHFQIRPKQSFWVGGPGATGGSGFGASVGQQWKFGKRSVDKQFLKDVKVEDGKLKIPVGKDKSTTIRGVPGGKGFGASVGFEWKFE